MGERWETPFTDAQVEALRAHQANPQAHPYTCPEHGALVVSWDGMECPEPECWYQQHWSHAHV